MIQSYFTWWKMTSAVNWGFLDVCGSPVIQFSAPSTVVPHCCVMRNTVCGCPQVRKQKHSNGGARLTETGFSSWAGAGPSAVLRGVNCVCQGWVALTCLRTVPCGSWPLSSLVCPLPVFSPLSYVHLLSLSYFLESFWVFFGVWALLWPLNLYRSPSPS